MSRPDATASALLSAEVIRPKKFIFIDFLEDPMRINSSGADVTLNETGFAELDGHSFLGISSDFINIDPVKNKEGGSDSIVARLSGLIDLDNEMLNQIGDRRYWYGRTVQIWQTIHDANGNQGGGIIHYYTGYLVNLRIESAPDKQLIVATIESYLAAFSEASHRDYDQSKFDPDDKSYEASIAIANGTNNNPIINNTPVGGSIGGGGRASVIGRQISER